jgi:hypothetical protein
MTVYGRWISYTYMKQKKSLVIGLSGIGKGLRARDSGNKVNNVQYKSNQNCTMNPPIQ